MDDTFKSDDEYDNVAKNLIDYTIAKEPVIANFPSCPRAAFPVYETIFTTCQIIFWLKW